MRRSTSDRRGLAGHHVVVLLLLAAVAVALAVRFATRPGAARPAPGEVETGSAIDTTRGPLEMAVKPAPGQLPDFLGCPPQGDSPRAASLNLRKNRVDEGDYRPVPFDSILLLPWPRTAENRMPDRWEADDRDSIGRYEGIPVAVEGYLAGAREAGPESPNCHGASDELQDWHVWLTRRRGADRTRSIVTEPTPRVRARHPGWTLAKLRRLQRDTALVRVSGWLMFDPEHPEQVGKTRGTLWEIHPVMRIDVRRGRRWVPLDSVPPRASSRPR
jgi:hypothetical protein